MDPHKRSVTIEVMDAEETVLGGGRFGDDAVGYRSMLRYPRDRLAWLRVVGRRSSPGLDDAGRHMPADRAGYPRGPSRSRQEEA